MTTSEILNDTTTTIRTSIMDAANRLGIMKSSSSDPEGCGSLEATSGFILKLYQMVNGAPDEVITWTPDGDAFVIGSDLRRLEEETLPHFFRHNRFQSLVRQLNFYSFRKINRERNVWIYKHHLFHRDKPEDLHLVRRRTCPGLDGRKQRFSRLTSRKATHRETSCDAKCEDDSSSVKSDGSQSVVASVVDDSSVNSPAVNPKTLDLDMFATIESQSRAFRRISSYANDISISVNENLSDVPVTIDASSPQDINDSLLENVDTSMVEPDATDFSEDDNKSFTDVKDDRSAIREQAVVVSEVAMKLEQFARKAMNGRGYYRTRRGGSGVVTPPYAVASGSRGLITYDDEAWYDNEDFKFEHSSAKTTRIGYDKVATDSAFFAGHSEQRYSKLVTPTKPVADQKTVEGIVQRILSSSLDEVRGPVVASANVAGFCMSLLPYADKDISGKILHLIASCDSVASEFNLYRSALHPSEPAEKQKSSSLYCSSSPGSRSSAACSVHQIWKGEGNRSDAVRDFRIFAVNCLQKLSGKTVASDFHSNDCVENKLISSLTPRDKKILECTAEIWQNSVGMDIEIR